MMSPAEPAVRHAAGREPAQGHGEDGHRHQAGPEGGHRLAEEGKGRDQVVGGRILLDRRVDADGNGNDDGQEGREAHQQDGVPHPLARSSSDTGVPVCMVQDLPKSNLDDLAQPAEIAPLVEPAGLLHGVQPWGSTAPGGAACPGRARRSSGRYGTGAMRGLDSLSVSNGPPGTILRIT